jgi:ribosomal protein L29
VCDAKFESKGESKSNDRKTKSVAQLAHALRELEGALSAWDQESSAKAEAATETMAADRRELKRGVSPEELRRKTRELLIELKAQIDEL